MGCQYLASANTLCQVPLADKCAHLALGMRKSMNAIGRLELDKLPTAQVR